MTTINWLMLLREIIAVYSENHTKPINILCGKKKRGSDYESRWYRVTTGL
jgi:hypothetical protein